MKKKKSEAKKQKKDGESAIDKALETALATQKLAKKKWKVAVQQFEKLSKQWQDEFDAAKKEIKALRKAKKKAAKKKKNAKQVKSKSIKKKASVKVSSTKTKKTKPVKLTKNKGDKRVTAKKVIKTVASNTYPTKHTAKLPTRSAAKPPAQPIKASPVKAKVEVTTKTKKAKTRPAKRKAAPRKPTVKKATTRRAANFKRIEGIGPKIEQLIKAEGITTFESLGKTKVGTLRAILEKAGPRYNIHNPSSWAQQARYAALGQWDRLKAFQDKLKGGEKK